MSTVEPFSAVICATVAGSLSVSALREDRSLAGAVVSSNFTLGRRRRLTWVALPARTPSAARAIGAIKTKSATRKNVEALSTRFIDDSLTARIHRLFVFQGLRISGQPVG